MVDAGLSVTKVQNILIDSDKTFSFKEISELFEEHITFLISNCLSIDLCTILRNLFLWGPVSY